MSFTNIMIFDNARFQIYKIAGKDGDTFVNTFPQEDFAIYVLSKGAYKAHLGGEYHSTWYAGSEGVKDMGSFGSHGSYEELRAEHPKYTIEAVGDCITHCISSNKKNNRNKITGDVKNISEGEIINIETQYCFIGNGSVQDLENNKVYKSDTLLNRRNKLKALEDSTVAFFDVDYYKKD